ncbi:hypothetical protein CEE45_08250 [Candidatus Heimdallarchaeota archaeon B3_Heim]|nr:MAG: hypothetical protein CEE45_08250 [Candidatus Heimdallarchaeota archaeon B3_Heim]
MSLPIQSTFNWVTPLYEFIYPNLILKVSGNLREAYFNEGKYVDSVIMNLLNSEWRASRI